MVRLEGSRVARRLGDFQYSLCRVVLMVTFDNHTAPADVDFQYSLCRVVLMVQLGRRPQLGWLLPFSTRSVESF